MLSAVDTSTIAVASLSRRLPAVRLRVPVADSRSVGEPQAQPRTAPSSDAARVALGGLLSRASFEAFIADSGAGSQDAQGQGPGQGDDTSASTTATASAESGSAQDLTDEQEAQVRDLKQRDAEVRQHEAAHKTVGGPLASPPTFEYTRGPDGRQYAVSGEVKIDATPENDPEDTIRKMEQVKAAALAPAEPSPQDRQVAAQADATKAQAQVDLNRQKREDEEEQRAENAEGPPGALADPSESGDRSPNTGPSAADRRGIAAYGQAIQAISAAAQAFGALSGAAPALRLSA